MEKVDREESREENSKPLRMKILDFGGQHEYVASIPFLIRQKGVFMICFPSKYFKTCEDVREHYQSKIGSFIQLLIQCSFEHEGDPIVILVATKVDDESCTLDKDVENYILG